MKTPKKKVADETLADSSPLTLAAAFLEYLDMADVTWLSNAKGSPLVSTITPTKLRHWRQDFFHYRGNGYVKLELEEFTADLVNFLNSMKCFNSKFDILPVKTTTVLIKNVILQLRSLCQVKAKSMPVWLDGEPGRPHPNDVISFSNGMVDLKGWLDDPNALQANKPNDEWFHAPTPFWFCESILPRSYGVNAKCPNTLKFLRSCLEDDDQIDLAQEWLGYILSRDNRFEKMMWLHGEGGAGKGTFSKIAGELVGESNRVTFELTDLIEKFTLNSWIGKGLAICRDAHLSGREDAHKVISTIFAVVGRDPRFIDRKNKDAIADHELHTRLMIALNEFPSLPGAESAMRRRSLVLSFGKSYVGTADAELFERKIKPEMSGVTAWAMQGLRRLHENKDFTVTERGTELIDRLSRLNAPVKDFVDELLIVHNPPANPNENRPWLLKIEVYKRWCEWQKARRYREINFNTFCEKVYAASNRKIGPGRPRRGDERKQVFQGCEWRPDVDTN